MNAARLLWDDTRIYRRRYAKSAAALVATAQAIRKHRPLGGGEKEFLSLYRVTAEFDPGHFTAVWLDPTAYFWVRMAYQLTATCLTGSPLPPLAVAYCQDVGAATPRDALAMHLDAYKRFVLAMWIAADGRGRFARPLDVALPFAVPGAGMSLVGPERARIRGVRDGRLDVEHDGRRTMVALGKDEPPANGLRAVRCPVLAAGGAAVHLQPHAFNLPGLPFAGSAAQQTFAFQTGHHALVEQALRLVRRHHPRAHGHFVRLMRLLVLKPPRTGDYSNLTHSDLPGAAICSIIADPYEMADTLIHELHHNRLFFIEEKTGPFFTDPTASVLTQRYYSPWRNDLRPLHGLLHALYVYLPVARFWLGVHRSGEVRAERRCYVDDRVLRIAAQLRVAAAVLRRHAELTRAGAALLAEMERAVRGVVRAVRARGLPRDTPAIKLQDDGSLVPERNAADGRPLTVEESVTAHIARYDEYGQCGERAEFRRLFLDAARGTGVHEAKRSKRRQAS